MMYHKRIRAAYTGTFDPITYGHVDVIQRAAAMFEELVVAIANNASKKTLFTPEERLELTQKSLQDTPNVKVILADGLITDFAHHNDIQVLVRGVRGVGDYEYEKQMALMNRDLAPDIETILLMPSPIYSHISSTLVREIAFHGGHIDGLVPEVVAKRLRTHMTS